MDPEPELAAQHEARPVLARQQRGREAMSQDSYGSPLSATPLVLFLLGF